ncbi:MAG: RNA methyltransferase [Lachnospiraceae bacterium]|nr:RNA methyltransferase [Lachnospiraceae bacterium]
MITSTSNPQMKYIMQLNKKAKTRYEQRVFVVEGVKMCRETPKEQIEKIYVSERFMQTSDKAELWKKCAYEVVSERVFQGICDTKTPQGILCLVKMPQYELQDLLVKKAHLLILEDIQDPGNLGTMLRTGEGAGITGVIMSRGTVDIFHPKVIRSTMGSLFRVPFYVAEDLSHTIHSIKEQGVTVYAAHLKGSLSYDKADYTDSCGFLIGNEGNGLSAEIASLADTYIRIPMQGKIESLNAATAAALLMYEAGRQRRSFQE